MPIQYQTADQAALLSGVDDNDLVLTVSRVDLFPAIPGFRVRLGVELMLVTGISGNDLTVVRAFGGTLATSHTVRTPVIFTPETSQPPAPPGTITQGVNSGVTGARVFRDNTSNALRFRRILSGSNVTVTEGVDAITIASTGGGSSTVADDIAKSAGTAIDRVQGIRGVPIETGTLPIGGSYVYDPGTYTGGTPRLKRRGPPALDPRDFGCPWDGVGDDLPGLEALLASIPSDQVRPVRVLLPPGEGYCSDNLHINRPVEFVGRGKAYAAFTSVHHAIRFPPLKGIVLHGYFTSPDYPGGRSDGSTLRDLNVVSTRAVVSDAVGNWGRAGYQLDTSYDVWALLPSTVALGSVVVKSSAPVGSDGGDYYGDGTTRDTTHLVMFRCSLAGSKGSGEPAAFATAGLGDLGTTITATSGTAEWVVESVPKDYENGATYVSGQRVLLPGDPDHVFECVSGGTSLSVGSLNYSAWGIGLRCPPAMVAPTYGLQFYDRTTVITAPSDGVALPVATIDVEDTTDFAASGTLHIWTGSAFTSVSYTGKTATTFTGCTGGVGTLSTGREVGSGILWKVIPSGGITVLGNWVDLDNVAVYGATGCAIWITGNYVRAVSGAGGSNFWTVRNAIMAYCGSGLTLNSNNANGGESRHCQQLFLGAGNTNVDALAYLNLAPLKVFGNGAAGVKDRVQGNNTHTDHYLQFSGGRPFRNDLFGLTPLGNHSRWDKLSAESDFLSEFLYPAAVGSVPYGVTEATSALVVDGASSRNIRAVSALVTDPTKTVTTTVGPALNGSVAALTMQHEDDSYSVGFGVTEDLLYYPAKWWTFGKANGAGFFDQQAFLVPRPSAGATWPSGTAVGAELPVWINNARVWIGGAPNADPPSIGFGTDPSLGSSYYVQGSVVWNSAATVGQPKGWQCTVSGSPGTWVSMGNL